VHRATRRALFGIGQQGEHCVSQTVDIQAVNQQGDSLATRSTKATSYTSIRAILKHGS